MLVRFATAVLACALFTAPVIARAAPESTTPAELVQSLHFQTGSIALADAGAHLQVASGFRYLGHDDTRRVLEQLWGNPPDDDVIGMLVPEDAALDGDHSWAVLVTYNAEGHVSDEDASKIDYAQMLADMKQETADANAARKEAGFGSVQLLGWAQPPTYDAAGKRLHWARELDFSGASQHTLNYDIRVLGREGYLSMNAIAGMGDLARVQAGMARILPMAQFDPGHGYADYKPGSDKLAAYGLAALVGGGLAAKAGLFAKLGVLLLAGKKFLVLAVLGIGAFVRKLFGKGKDKDKDGTVV